MARTPSTSARRRRWSRGAFDPIKTLIAVVMIGVLVGTLTWLQGRYDESDHRKAVELVTTYRAQPAPGAAPIAGAPTIPQLIRAQHPWIEEKDIAWSSAIKNAMMGDVRVTAYVPRRGDRPEATYEFDVRLTGPSIHPTDPRTVDIMKALSVPLAKTATVGAVGTTTTATAAR
ncbi:hypothetical protein L6R52_00790 [Myxococcota bacterium]|nr:hypothetical protein [Myxococcota bacterium]